MTMNDKLTDRLNAIEEKITSNDFIKSRGLGNEIAFYIFDYPPSDELRIREHIDFMLKRIKSHTNLDVINVNLFDFVVDHLKERDLLDRSIKLEQKKSSNELKKALRAPLKAEILVKLFDQKIDSTKYDLVLISGVGNAWPMVRSHSLLNNLQPIIGNTPLVLFYPGSYDGQTVELFGKLKSHPYYRAFKLIP